MTECRMGDFISTGKFKEFSLERRKFFLGPVQKKLLLK